MIRLTDIQRDTLRFIIETIAECGYPPTIREMRARFGITINAVHDRLRGLTRKGAIMIDPFASRGIRVRGVRWVPVLDPDSHAAAALRSTT